MRSDNYQLHKIVTMHRSLWTIRNPLLAVYAIPMESTKPTETTPTNAPPRKRVKVSRATRLMGRIACAVLAAAFACYVTIANPVLLSYGTPAVAGMSLLGGVMGFFVSEMSVMVVAVVIGIALYSLLR